jgi:hypothetical protein
MQGATLFAAIDLATQRRCAALQDGLQCPFLAGQNRQAGTSLRSGGAEDIRYLQHENLSSAPQP